MLHKQGSQKVKAAVEFEMKSTEQVLVVLLLVLGAVIIIDGASNRKSDFYNFIGDSCANFYFFVKEKS